MVSSILSSLTSSFLSSSGTANQAAKIYLQNSGSKIQLPIPPSSFKVRVRQGNSTVNINNLGELNMLGKTGLITIGLRSFFPNQEYSFCQCTLDSPYSYVNTIDGWRTSGKPSRITISDTPINYAVSIEEFEWGEHDGTGDVYFELELKEYKFVGGATDDTINSTTGLKDRTDASSVAAATKTITVYPGDSLMDVASRALGQSVSITDTTKSYLTAYKTLAKKGGLSVGSVLKVTGTKSLKVGDTNIQLQS